MKYLKVVRGIGRLVLLLLALLVSGYTLYSYFSAAKDGEPFGIFVSFVLWSTYFSLKNSQKSTKDELDHHITIKSLKVSYYILISLIGVVVLIDEYQQNGTMDLSLISNVPLLIILGSSMLLFPLVKYIISFKYH